MTEFRIDTNLEKFDYINLVLLSYLIDTRIEEKKSNKWISK